MSVTFNSPSLLFRMSDSKLYLKKTFTSAELYELAFISPFHETVMNARKFLQRTTNTKIILSKVYSI